jgi:NADPH-dependent curcumin reductase CurA
MYGIRNLGQMFLKRLSMHGFICSDERHVKYLETFGKDIVTWMMEGKIKTKEEVLVGLDLAPQALLRVWKGEKFGKMVLKVDEN